MNPMGLGLRAVRTLAGSDALDRLGVRERVERLVYRGSRDGFKAATTAGRTFAAATKLGRPARPKSARGRELFDLTPDDEQQMLVEAFGDFAAERLRKAALDADAATAAPKELLDELAGLGVAQLGVPEELGGVVSERSSVTGVLVAEALGHGDMGLAVAALAPAGVATVLSLWGDAEQQSTYLPAFAGEDVPAAAIAVMEPQPLSDPLRPRTMARRVGGGDYVLSGVKALVPRAAQAELLVVSAELDGDARLFLVEGAFVSRERPGMGIRAAGTGEVLFEDFRVGPGALIEDAGAFLDVLRRGRLAWCALACGTARAVLDYVMPYVNERKAFGEPISHRQAVAFAVADIAIELEGMRLTTLRAAARADQGKGFSREVALARALCSEKAMRIGSDGVQLLGGHGYVKEHPVERWYRDLRAAGLMEGALAV